MSSLNFTCTFINSGVINVGDFSVLSGESTFQTATLSGGGQIVLSGGSLEETAQIPTGTLVNQNNIISGYGAFSAGRFDNQAGGLIDGDSDAGVLVIAAGVELSNEGTIEASDDTSNGNSGSLNIAGVVQNAGTIETVETGQLTISGTVTGGVVASTNAGQLTLSGTVSNCTLDDTSANASLVIAGLAAGVTLDTLNGAAIDLDGGTLSGGVSSVVNNGAVTIGGAQTGSLLGAIVNLGSIALSGSGQLAKLLVGAKTTLSGGGQIVLSDGGVNAIDAAQLNGTLVNQDNVISGNGDLGLGDLVLTNQGTVDATGASPLFVELSNGLASVNTGVFEATSGGEIQFVRGHITNSGALTAGAGSTVEIAKAMQFTNYSAGLLTGGAWAANGGTLIFGDGTITTDAATISLSGAGSTFVSGSGYTFSTLEQTLTTIAAGGALQINQFAYVTSNAIELDGSLSVGLNGSSFSSGLITASATSSISGGAGVIASSLVDSGSVGSSGLHSLTFTGASETFTGALSGNGIVNFSGGAHAALNAGATVTLASLSLAGAGTTLAVNETLADNGGVSEAAGATLTIALNDSFSVAAASSFAGAISGAGALTVAGGVTAFQSGAALTQAKFATSGAGAAVTINENLAYAGAFTQGAGTRLVVGGTDTLTLSGTNTLSGATSGAGALALAAGDTTFATGATLATALWSLSGVGATATIAAPLSYSGKFSAGAGALLALTGANLALRGASTLAGVTVSSAGAHALVLYGASSVSGLGIAGDALVYNLGTATQSGGAITVGDGVATDRAELYNAVTGVWGLADNSGVARGADTASFIANLGLFEKTGGTGTSTIATAINNTGSILAASGVLDIKGAVNGAGAATVSGAATLKFDAGVAAAQSVAFAGSGATLSLGALPSFAATIFGYDSGGATHDAVSLLGAWTQSGFSENAGDTLATLTFTLGSLHETLHFAGAYTAANFHASVSGGVTTIN